MSWLALLVRRLVSDRSGLAMVETAFVLPVLVLLSLTGAEMTNYITVKMRMSQVALQIADNAARMGSGTATQAKQVTETDINDVFIGSQMESAGLDLQTNGRVILTDIETASSGASTYKIGWQRCYGNQVHASTSNFDTNTGMGPRMFVEVYYVYKPILKGVWAPTTTLTEIASMSVRERRDVSQIYNTANATPASC